MKLILLIIIALLPFSCTLRNTVVGAAQPIVSGIETSFYTESDIQLAKEALPSIIKIAEGLYHYNPSSQYLAGKLCFLYAAYNFGYVDNTPYDDFDEDADKFLKRINSLYAKSASYGNSAIPLKRNQLMALLRKPQELELGLAKLNRSHNEALFWFVFSKALLLFNDTANPVAVMELEGLLTICKHLEKTEPSFLYGGTYALLLAIYGGRDEAIGGNLELAESYYQKALTYSEGKSLIPDYVYLRYVSILQDNDQKYIECAQKIEEFDAEAFPEFIFINNLIKEKSAQFLKKKELFF